MLYTSEIPDFLIPEHTPQSANQSLTPGTIYYHLSIELLLQNETLMRVVHVDMREPTDHTVLSIKGCPWSFHIKRKVQYLAINC